MLSRALSLAAVLLLIGSFAPNPALAQENLDAGKTPSQIFAATCNVCHKSPRGLLRTVSPSSLPSFLRQHYTTSPNMAGALASYLVSNGAADTRIGGEGPRGAKGVKQEAKQEVRPAGAQPQQLDRFGRPIHPATAPQEASAPATEQKPEAADTQANVDRGPDGRKLSAKQKLSKRGKPGEALPKEEPSMGAGEPKAGEKSEPKAGETAAREEGKSEAGRSEAGRSEAGRSEAEKPEAGRSPDEGRSQSAKIEQPPATAVVRPDPVPQVTPAGSANAGAPAQGARALAMPAPLQSAPIQAAVSPPAAEMAVPLNVPPPPPPAVTASAPPLPPVQPAGPPVPPISQ